MGVRVCVCTSYHGDSEPRAPRHAAAIAELASVREVIFVECVPAGESASVVPALSNNSKIRTSAHWYAHKRVWPVRTLFSKSLRRIAMWIHAAGGGMASWILSSRVVGVTKHLRNVNADVYVAHNIDMLLPAARAARKVGALVVFDAMEFYSDMGDGQSVRESAMIREIEQSELRRCALTLASSDQLAEALVVAYGIRRPIALYNTPPVVPEIRKPAHEGLALYWRNSVLGFGQRGLEDILVALTMLPADISLHLRGRLGKDGGSALSKRILELGLTSRVVVHPPHLPDDAVEAASEFDVGLCLERAGIRNHDLTVSNKLFDYMMAGLAVVTSDLTGLRSVVERAGAGLCYRPGSPTDLADKIFELYQAPDLRVQLSQNARRFALASGNRDADMMVFRREFARMLN